MRLIDRILRMEEINGGAECPTYMFRWTLLKLGKFLSIYLHHFVSDDWSRDMHDHPKRFISIGLKGDYVEETPGKTTLFFAPWVRTFPANHIHRIRLAGNDCWTLVIVGRAVREWGFWTKGKWMHWKKYVGSDAAQVAKNC